jgi:hypothetical protein
MSDRMSAAADMRSDITFKPKRAGRRTFMRSRFLI